MAIDQCTQPGRRGRKRLPRFECVCELCGVEFTARPKRRFCAPRCALTQLCWNNRKAEHYRTPLPSRNCTLCGESYVPCHKGQRFCSPQCSQQNQRTRPIGSCVVCCQAFPARHNHGVPQRFCSRRCVKVHRTEMARRRRPPCVQCGGPVEHRARRKCRRCLEKLKAASSVAREASVQRAADRAQRKAERSCRLAMRRELRPCAECGQPFTPGRNTKFCTERCARRNDKRSEKRLRRARCRGLRAERVDPVKVFERDGWRCQLCGRRTPRRLLGRMVPAAPELDHIIPLGAPHRGPHTYRNTQCACRQCNGAKGATIVGQLRLV